MPRRTRTTRRRPKGGKALRMVKRLGKFVDQELHANYVDFVNTDVGSGGAVRLLSVIAQGDNFDDRTGSQIACRSLDFRMLVAIGTRASCLRVFMVVDKQANGAVATLPEVLQNIAGDGGPVTSHMNQNTLKRFKVLSDRSFYTGVNDQESRCYNWRIKLTHMIRYSGGSAAIGDLVSGAVLVFLVSDQGTPGAGPTVTFQSKLRFAP